MTQEVGLTGNQDIDGILWGWEWGTGGAQNLTFSFPTGTAEYGAYTAINGFSPSTRCNRPPCGRRSPTSPASPT
jgi:hypothetical protein